MSVFYNSLTFYIFMNPKQAQYLEENKVRFQNLFPFLVKLWCIVLLAKSSPHTEEYRGIYLHRISCIRFWHMLFKLSKSEQKQKQQKRSLPDLDNFIVAHHHSGVTRSKNCALFSKHKISNKYVIIFGSACGQF